MYGIGSRTACCARLHFGHINDESRDLWNLNWLLHQIQISSVTHFETFKNNLKVFNFARNLQIESRLPKTDWCFVVTTILRVVVVNSSSHFFGRFVSSALGGATMHWTWPPTRWRIATIHCFHAERSYAAYTRSQSSHLLFWSSIISHLARLSFVIVVRTSVKFDVAPITLNNLNMLSGVANYSESK